jgi:hypothetical protein
MFAANRLNPDANRQIKPAETILAFVILTVIVLLFHSFYYNKYFGIQDGWGNVYVAYIQQGKIPYRDFYLFSQPYSVLLSYTLAHFFGNTVFVLRSWGVLERVVIAFVLYLIFRRLLIPAVALLIGVVATIFGTGTFVEYVYEYGQTCFVFILLSTYFTINYIYHKTKKEISSAHKNLLAAGLCGGFAFITKQSIGLIAPFSTMVFLLCFGSCMQRRFFGKDAFYYALMFFIPTLVTLIVLSHFGATQIYLQQIFKSAGQSKGGLVSVLFGAFGRYFPEILLSLPVGIAIVSLFILNNYFYQNQILAAGQQKESYFLVAILLVYAVISGYFAAFAFTSLDVFHFFYFNKHHVLFSLLDTNLLLATFLFLRMFVRPLQAQEWMWFLLAVVGVNMVYGQGLSSEYDVRSTTLAMGVALALLYSFKVPCYVLKNTFLNILCVVWVGGVLMQHYIYPFNWWGWTSSPIVYSTETVSYPVLKGIKISEYTAKVFNDITRIITENSNPGDTIYEYPHMPIFYLLSNRYPSTFAVTDYMDVCSDQCAREDAARISQTPPKVMVIEEFPENAMQFHELVFRHGQRSGQRDLINTLNTLIKQYSYKEAASFPSTILGYNIQVWVRNGTGSKNG